MARRYFSCPPPQCCPGQPAGARAVTNSTPQSLGWGTSGPTAAAVFDGRINTVALDNQLLEGISMSKLAVKHQRRSLLPELSELFTGFPPWAGLRPTFDTHLIRL